ncbi:MAG TPA: protein kinase, partial [Gemmataceae bacterium]|nr:protein kinase [Gemmataceae bacterium]
LVALKMILSGEHAAEHELARFQAEAEAVARLQHPNIVQIYEVGEEQGRPFFSLEFVDGTSLDKKASGTPFLPREAGELVETIALAMHYAHEHGIIHRDLKPANVLLTADGTPKVGDFGLAKKVDDDAGQTRSGAVLGTPSYMAPEQAEGRLKDVGPVSDVYSLGAILYELLTGRPPFKGSSVLDTLNQLRTMEPVPPIQFQPGVPRDLETIALKCLQKDPARRYASAAELAADLRRFLNGEPILARPVSRTERLVRWCKRNPRVAALSGAVVGLVAVVLVGLAVFTVVFRVEQLRADSNAQAALDAKGVAEQEKKKADDNAADALTQKGIAEEKRKEADKQKGIADEKRKEADQNAVAAKKNEQRAKDTAKIAVDQVIDLGNELQNRLNGPRLSQANAPELRELRDQVLTLVRRSLLIVSKEIEGVGTTMYGQEAIAVDLGDLLTRLGQDQEAAKLYRQAYEQVKRQVEAYPNSDGTRANYGVIVVRVGDAARDADGDVRRAIDDYAESREVQHDILKHPRDGGRTPMQSKIQIAHVDIRLGKMYLALGRPAEARKYFEEAVACRQDWVDEAPHSPVPRSWLTEAHWWLGAACSYLGDDRGTFQYLGAAVHANEGLVYAYRHQPKEQLSFREDLAEIQGAWGEAMLRRGRPDEAQASCAAAVQNMLAVVEGTPDDMSHEPKLALAYEQLAAATAALGRADDARKHYADALKVREALHRLEPKNLAWHAAYAVALARAGQPAKAAAEAALVRPRAGKGPHLLMQLARCYAGCAAAQTPQRADYVKKALELLAAVTEKDYEDVCTLLTDTDLAAIRGEAGFRAVVAKVSGR